MLNVFGILGCAILCPIYYIGGQTDTLLSQLSIANIRGNELLGIAPTVMLVVFSVIAYLLIFRYIALIKRFATWKPNKPTEA
jgi:hypothetical protein